MSEECQLQGGGKVSNQEVIEWIKTLLDHPFICYGYEKVTDWLRQNKALIINKKKVYRLMKQSRLLLAAKKSRQPARCFVEVRVMVASQPGEAFQFDIKMYWVKGLGWVPCLSVIDIFTRQIKTYLLQASIRQADVKALWQDLLRQMPSMNKVQIRVRSDNGSQFAAHTVRSFFAAQGIHHEYCHVATPQEDAFIESFHSIVERELVSRHQWTNLAELEDLLARYIYFYNEERLHGSLRNVSPNAFARQWSEQQAKQEMVVSQDTTVAEELAITVQLIGG